MLKKNYINFLSNNPKCKERGLKTRIRKNYAPAKNFKYKFYTFNKRIKGGNHLLGI